MSTPVIRRSQIAITGIDKGQEFISDRCVIFGSFIIKPEVNDLLSLSTKYARSHENYSVHKTRFLCLASAREKNKLQQSFYKSNTAE